MNPGGEWRESEMADSKTVVGGGIGSLGMLGVLFVGLKLTGYIDWSWWWVTMPFWFWLAVIVSLVACAVAIHVFASMAERIAGRGK